MSGVRVEAPTESQGESLQLATAHFDDLQKALKDINAEGTRLRKLCADYRTQRTDLERTLATLRTDVALINSEKEDARIELVSEKEALAWWAHKEKEKEGASSSTKFNPSSGSRPPGGIRDIRSKAETAGRAIRKAHVLEGKVKDAELRYQALEEKRKENLEEERAIAAGLRDRIGRLEGRLRTTDQAKQDAQAAYEREKKDRGEELALWKEKEAGWKSERKDMLQLRDELRFQLAAAQNQSRAADVPTTASKPISRPLTPLQANRPIPNTPTRRSPATSIAPMTPSSLARRLAYMEDRHRALQADYEKARQQHEQDHRSWKEWKAAHMARQDEKRAKRAKRRLERINKEDEGEGPGPSTAISASSSAVQSRGSGKVSTRTQFPPPSAVVVVEASQESASAAVGMEDGDRAEEASRHSSEGVVDESLGMPAVSDGDHAEGAMGGVSVEASHAAMTHTLLRPETEEEMVELPEWYSPADLLKSQPDQPARPSQTTGAPTVHQNLDSALHSAHDQPDGMSVLRPDVSNAYAPRVSSRTNEPALYDSPARQIQRATGLPSRHRAASPSKTVTTPQAGTSHAIQASRTTPWLGKAPLGRTGSATGAHRPNVIQTMDDDVFASPPELAEGESNYTSNAPIPTFSSTTPAKLLVRDRTGRAAAAAAGNTSLLRSALHSRAPGPSTYGQVGDDHTPSRSIEQGQSGRMAYTPLRRSDSSGSITRLTGRIDLSTPRAGASTSTAGQASSSSKRKFTEVDLSEVDVAEMTPHEKQLYYKRLGQLPSAARKAVYSGYKGNGRYLPPDQLQKGIADEYEIDPKLNEGHTHQYHDVKRKRSERKQMHGGDCECCRGYYEAVGHIPRFNQAPKWSDTPDALGESAAGGQEGGGEAVQHHRQLVSRHREDSYRRELTREWATASTPPGYWAIGFPDTQDAAEQNRKAEEMTREKEARIRRDAELGNGKYRKKAPAGA